MTDDLDIELIKARKLKELREHAKSVEKRMVASKIGQDQKNVLPDKEVLKPYLYDRADEVLELAELQFPQETKLIIVKLLDLLKSGNLRKRISGRELLFLFKSVGLNIRLNTNINISEHGKTFSISEKLKEKD